MIHTHASATDYFGDNVPALLLSASVHLITSPWTSFGWSEPGAITVLPRTAVKTISVQPTVHSCASQIPDASPAIAVLAGATSRALAQALIHPIDTLKTRMMVTSGNAVLSSWKASVASTSTVLQLPGVSGAKLTLVNPCAGQGGVRSLYTGLGCSVGTALPAGLLFFGMQEACKKLLKKEKLNTAGTMMCACAASVVSAVVRVPGDILKHRVQVYLYPNGLAAVQDVLRRAGPRGLFCGFTATLLRDMPEMAIQFGMYSTLQNLANKRGQEQDGSESGHPNSSKTSRPGNSYQALVLGGISGAVACGVTTPLDVLKCQMQTQGTCNLAAAANAIMQHRGPAGFLTGLGPRVLQNAIMSAAFFFLFENLKVQFAKHAQQVEYSRQRPPRIVHPPRPNYLLTDTSEKIDALHLDTQLASMRVSTA